VAGRAWIRNFVFVGHVWIYKAEGVGMNHRPGNALTLDFWHMAGYAFTPRAAVLVVGMFFDGCSMRAIRGERPMTLQANLICRFSQLRVVSGSMHVVAGRTGDSMPVHDTLRKVVALHPVLMGRAVGEIIKAGLAERAVF
jgi:hypothetical protein